MTPKQEKLKTIADLIRQYKDNNNVASLSDINDKILSEVSTIPVPDHFQPLHIAVIGQLREEFDKFKTAKSEEGKPENLQESKLALGTFFTLYIIPLIGESYH